MVQVWTESGSLYEFTDDLTLVRRVNPDAGLRCDDDFMQLKGMEPPVPLIGERMRQHIVLTEGTPEGYDSTVRTTTPVVCVVGAPESWKALLPSE